MTPDEKRAEWVQLYQEGASLGTIAARYGTHAGAVRKVLADEARVEIRKPGGPINRKKRAQARRMLAAGKRHGEVARAVGLSGTAVCEVARELA